MIKCEASNQTNESRIAVKVDQVMKEVPSFIKHQEYFCPLRIKEKDSRREFTKVLLMCNCKIKNAAEILKEEFEELKTCLKAELAWNPNTTTAR